jgi:hypothetical protein
LERVDEIEATAEGSSRGEGKTRERA